MLHGSTAFSGTEFCLMTNQSPPLTPPLGTGTGTPYWWCFCFRRQKIDSKMHLGQPFLTFWFLEFASLEPGWRSVLADILLFFQTINAWFCFLCVYHNVQIILNKDSWGQKFVKVFRWGSAWPCSNWFVASLTSKRRVRIVEYSVEHCKIEIVLITKI